MDDFRPKSCGDVGPTPSGGVQDLRCHSATYAAAQVSESGAKFKKGRSTNGSGSQSWRLSDPEMQRRKRVASYKVYTVEGKVKGSLRKSFGWLKDRYSRVVYGWW